MCTQSILNCSELWSYRMREYVCNVLVVWPCVFPSYTVYCVMFSSFFFLLSVRLSFVIVVAFSLVYYYFCCFLFRGFSTFCNSHSHSHSHSLLVQSFQCTYIQSTSYSRTQTHTLINSQFTHMQIISLAHGDNDGGGGGGGPLMFVVSSHLACSREYFHWNCRNFMWLTHPLFEIAHSLLKCKNCLCVAFVARHRSNSRLFILKNLNESVCLSYFVWRLVWIVICDLYNLQNCSIRFVTLDGRLITFLLKFVVKSFVFVFVIVIVVYCCAL